MPGLYWAGDTRAGRRGDPAPDAVARDQVRLRVPGASDYQTVSGAILGTVPSGTDYAAFADVTALVQAAGDGAYTVANVQAGTGNDSGAGWSLVVAFAAPSEPPRNLTVFDGYAVVNRASGDVDINVAGFVTPPSGNVDTRIGAMTMEGDLGITGDRMRLNNRTLSDAAHPSRNFFNSAVHGTGFELPTSFPTTLISLASICLR